MIVKNKKLARTIVVLSAGGGIYLFVLYFFFHRLPFSSDDANFVLEANDILHGNFFLKGWNLTGISFVGSDLLYYIVGVAIAGVSRKAAVIAAMLIYLSLTIISVALICEKDKKIDMWGICCYMVFAGIPCFFLANMARYHTASVTEGLVSLYIILKAKDADKKRKCLACILSFFLLAIAVMSDAVSVLVIVVPVLLVSVYKILYNFYYGYKSSKGHILLILLSFGAVFLGFILDKLYFFYGGCNKNTDFLSAKGFISIGEWQNHIHIYIEILLKEMNSYFPQTSLLSLNTFFSAIGVLVLMISIIVILYNIICWVMQINNRDYIATVMSVGIVLSAIVFIITDIGADIGCARYLGWYPAFFMVILARTYRNIKFTYPNRHFLLFVKILSLTAGVGIMVNTFLLFPIDGRDSYYKQEKLAKVLMENNLNSGYGAFWDSSSTSVLSGNKVHVRAITGFTGYLRMYNWFCKSNWYKEPATFVVVKEEDVFGCTWDNIVALLGEPDTVIHVDDKYVIMNYNDDISKCLIIDD